SWITLLSPWPVWRIAVMLGGGMTITYGSRDESARAVNTSRSSQRWYRRRSTACGSYWGGSSKRGCGIPYNRQDGGGSWRRVEVGGGEVPVVLEYRVMVDEMSDLPNSRLARWLAIAVVIVCAVELYFCVGRRVPSLSSPVA